MSNANDLEQAFQLYFDEMRACVSAGRFFALLHVILVLPDVCAALENPSAEVGSRYKAWCAQYHAHPLLSAEEFYDLRCKFLHQGQALGTKGRYETYSFPIQAGVSFHRVAVPAEKNVTLDPCQMAEEMERAVRAWFTDLREPANANRLASVRSNLRFLVRRQPKELPGIGGQPFLVMSSS